MASADRKPPGAGGRGRGRGREDGTGGRGAKGMGRGMDDGLARGSSGGRGRGGPGGRTGGSRGINSLLVTSFRAILLDIYIVWYLLNFRISKNVLVRMTKEKHVEYRNNIHVIM